MPVSQESWITPMMNPMPTTCMEISSGIPNRLQAKGIKSREPPATPEDPAALMAATTHMIRALPAETWTPSVWAAASAMVEMVMAAPAIRRAPCSRECWRQNFW